MKTSFFEKLRRYYSNSEMLLTEKPNQDLKFGFETQLKPKVWKHLWL